MKSMSDHDIAEWVSMLWRTRLERIRVICDLLAHANGDRMSGEDVQICRQALGRLQTEHAA